MGGSQQIAYRMRDKILKERSSSITYNSVVNRVGYIEVDDLDKENVEVGFKDGISKTFHAVFNSAPLGAQQHMKLDLLNLNWGNKLAIGSLAYGASCKIGIRFKKMWWITKCGIKGGVAKTDRSIRACVYPSYNVYDDPEQPGVLLASYTWSAEAERIGSLIQRGSPKDEEELKELLFHDPALLHARDADPESYKDMYDIIKEQYMDHFAYDWGSDKRQVGVCIMSRSLSDTILTVISGFRIFRTRAVQRSLELDNTHRWQIYHHWRMRLCTPRVGRGLSRKRCSRSLPILIPAFEAQQGSIRCFASI